MVDDNSDTLVSEIGVQGFADTHTYLVNGTQTLGAVTRLVRQCARVFDANAIIERMLVGRNWPRPGDLRSELLAEDFKGVVLASVPSYVDATHVDAKLAACVAVAGLDLV